MSTNPTRRPAGTPTGGQFAPEAHAEPEVSLATNAPERESTPATDGNGDTLWFTAEGQLHRTDGPAIERADGGRFWYVDGQLHRTDGPACEVDDDRQWWVNGQLHRTDGPAIEIANGYRAWFLHGQRHRSDGPAVERADGSKEWWVDGMRYMPDDHGRPNVCDEAALCSDHGLPLADGCWKCDPEDYCAECHAPLAGGGDGGRTFCAWCRP